MFWIGALWCMGDRICIKPVQLVMVFLSLWMILPELHGHICYLVNLKFLLLLKIYVHMLNVNLILIFKLSELLMAVNSSILSSNHILIPMAFYISTLALKPLSKMARQRGNTDTYCLLLDHSSFNQMFQYIYGVIVC